MDYLVTGAAIIAGAVGAVVVAPVVLGAIGFTSAGIAVGSYAAAAAASGGGVAAGSVVAILQSAGMDGISTGANAALACAGGAAAAAREWLFS